MQGELEELHAELDDLYNQIEAYGAPDSESSARHLERLEAETHRVQNLIDNAQ